MTEVDLASIARRAFAFPCLDATERRPHLAGVLGACLCQSLMERGWLVRRRRGERAVPLTEPGRAGIAEALGCGLPEVAGGGR